QNSISSEYHFSWSGPLSLMQVLPLALVTEVSSPSSTSADILTVMNPSEVTWFPSPYWAWPHPLRRVTRMTLPRRYDGHSVLMRYSVPVVLRGCAPLDFDGLRRGLGAAFFGAHAGRPTGSVSTVTSTGGVDGSVADCGATP